jgi:hypothetical protein
METYWADNLLREQAYSAVVIDQFLLENEPGESDPVLEHLGTAFPLYRNFAIRGMERLEGEVRSVHTGASGKRLRLGTQSSNSSAAKCVKASRPCCSLRTGHVRPRSARSCAAKIRAVDHLAREMSLRLGAKWRFLTMAVSACPEKVAPSIHNGEIAAQKVFPA